MVTNPESTIGLAKIAYEQTDGSLAPVAVSTANPLPVTIDGTIVAADMNLIKVGGSAIALGQTTKSASIPVTLASDQGAVTVLNAAGSAVMGKVGIDQTIPGTTNAIDQANYTTEIDYVGGTNAIYIGQAAAGTITSIASWRIKKITYDGNSNPTVIAWAAGVTTFSQIWDNRASLSYS